MKKYYSFIIIVFYFTQVYAQQLTTPMSFIVNSPQTIFGELDYGYPVDYGPTTLTTVTGDLEWAYTAALDSFCCTPIVTSLTGKIALIRRGNCSFTSKIYEAQLQGAIGCIILNNVITSSQGNMTTSGHVITIPSVILSYNDGLTLTTEMEQGNTVNASFFARSLSSARLSFAYKTPIDQIVDLTASVILWNTTGAPQSGTMTLDIIDPTGVVTNSTGTYGSIPVGDPSWTDFGVFTPTVLGTYYGIFKSPFNPNDSIVSSFEITPSTYSLDNGDLGNAQGTGLSDLQFDESNYVFHRGAVFLTGLIPFDADIISASFALENAGTYLGEQFTYTLYQDPSTGFLGNEQDYSTFTEVGTAVHTVTVADTLSPHLLMTEPLIDPNTSLALLSLMPNRQYMMVIKYQGNGLITESPRYSSTHRGDYLSVSQTVYTDRLYMNGFTSRKQPVIRLNRFLCPLNETIDTQDACYSYTWIDGNTYTASNNTAIHTLPSVSGCDSTIVLDLTINNAVLNTQNLTECPGVQIVVGSNTYSVAGIYIDTLVSVSGCDSIVTTDLAITPVNTTVIDLSPLLVAQTIGAQYQWVNCDNGNTPISGETGQSFLPSTSGNYAVVVTEDGCDDTSSCFFVDFAGIKELDDTQISIFPNPTNDGIFKVQFEGEIQHMEIIDMIGRTIELPIDTKNGLADGSSLKAGKYFVKITSSSFIIVKEVIVL